MLITKQQLCCSDRLGQQGANYCFLRVNKKMYTEARSQLKRRQILKEQEKDNTNEAEPGVCVCMYGGGDLQKLDLFIFVAFD